MILNHPLVDHQLNAFEVLRSSRINVEKTDMDLSACPLNVMKNKTNKQIECVCHPYVFLKGKGV
jgi:hypothetical protein